MRIHCGVSPFCRASDLCKLQSREKKYAHRSKLSTRIHCGVSPFCKASGLCKLQSREKKYAHRSKLSTRIHCGVSPLVAAFNADPVEYLQKIVNNKSLLFCPTLV